MDASLALVPVHAFPALFSGTDTLFINHNHSSGRFARETADIIYECDELNRIYGSDGLEIVGSVSGTLIDIYI